MMPSDVRLHPATLLFDLVTHIRRFAVPAVFVMFGATRSSGGPGNMFGRIPSGWEMWLLVLLVPAAVVTIARYLSFRLRYDEHELVVRTGLFFRNERHVPYSRIQNVDAIQNLFHRFFQVVEVHVETGGGKEEEARFSVLSTAAFEDLRARVFRGRSAAASPGAEQTESDAAAVPAGETLMHLPLRELLLCGLLENKGMVVIGAAYGVVWETGVMDAFWGGLFGDDSAGRGFFRAIFGFLFDGQPLPMVPIALGAMVGVGLLLFVRLVSMAWAFVRLYEFRLTRIGDDLRTVYGLFTRVTTTVPIRRVQTVIVSSGPLHRWLGRATVRVETAGGVGANQSGGSVREWLAPLIRTEAVPALIAQVVPGFDLSAVAWQPVHARAFRRAAKPNVIVAAGITAAAAVAIGWGALGVLLLTMPWALLSARQYVAHLGWAEHDEVVVMRSGWIWQQLTVARINKIQAVTLRQSPFDRRAAMARVRVDTAGARELSHRIDVPYLDAAVAADLHRRLSAQAANTAFKW
jgi:putative membrane protein